MLLGILMSKETRMTKKEELHRKAEEEGRLEIRYPRHPKRKYPEETKNR